MEPIAIVLLIFVCLLAAVLLGGYGAYHMVIERHKEKTFPRRKRAKTELGRYYTANYLRQMQWLDAYGYERVSIQSKDGQKLAGMLFLAKNPTDRTVLAVHGYRSRGTREYLYMAPMYLEGLSMNLLLVDNYAHGGSGGKRLGFGHNDRRDILAWAGFLVERFGPSSEILLQGVSMGASAVLMAAGDPLLPKQVRWVVADCPFTNAGEVIRCVMHRRYFLPAFPFYHLATMYCKLLAGYYFGEADAEGPTADIRIPVLFVHGARDKFVPPEMSNRLYNVCAAPKEKLEVPLAAHAESYLADPQGYQKAVQRLLEKQPVDGA